MLEAGRYWSRDGQTEIDLMARLEGERFLYGECKWSGRSEVGMGIYNALQAKVARLPREGYRRDAHYVLFSAGGFAPELGAVADNPENRLSLIGPADLLPGTEEE